MKYILFDYSMMNKRRQNPYPTNLKLPDLIKLKYDCQIKILNDKITDLELRIFKLENILQSSNITPHPSEPLPTFSPLEDDNIHEFHLCMKRENASSFDNIDLMN